jgi:hypothetical protein
MIDLGWVFILPLRYRVPKYSLGVSSNGPALHLPLSEPKLWMFLLLAIAWTAWHAISPARATCPRFKSRSRELRTATLPTRNRWIHRSVRNKQIWLFNLACCVSRELPGPCQPGRRPCKYGRAYRQKSWQDRVLLPRAQNWLVAGYRHDSSTQPGDLVPRSSSFSLPNRM